MIKRHYALVLLAVLLLPLISYGQAKVGTAGLQFLKVGVGARAVGMGEAFTAVSDDATALYYNPAGLIQLRRPEATFSLVNYPAGIKFIFVGAAIPTPRTSGVFGVSVTSLFSDDMPETTPGMPYGTGRNFSASDLAAGLSYSQRLTDKFSVGGSLKILNERLADASATGWSIDIGTFYTTGWRKINIGMVIQHFGGVMNFVDSPFPLPIIFKFGGSFIAYEIEDYKLLVASEFAHPNDNVEIYHLGAEFSFRNMFSLRMGKTINGFVRDTWEAYDEDSQNDPFIEYPLFERDMSDNLSLVLDGFAFGLGFRIPQAGVNIDYAWTKLGTLGAVHRFTIGYMLNGLFR